MGFCTDYKTVANEKLCLNATSMIKFTYFDNIVTEPKKIACPTYCLIFMLMKPMSLHQVVKPDREVFCCMHCRAH